MKIKIIAPNQTEIHLTDSVVFFSYETPVAAKINGKYYVTNETFSRTTTKHIKAWLESVNAESLPQEFFNAL
jgi:hypothetical protein